MARLVRLGVNVLSLGMLQAGVGFLVQGIGSTACIEYNVG